MTRRISRRGLLKAGALAGAGLLAGGCRPDAKGGTPRSLAQELAPTSITRLPGDADDPTPTATTPVPPGGLPDAKDGTPESPAEEVTPTSAAYLPYVTNDPTPTATNTPTHTPTATHTPDTPPIAPQVVHVHAPAATSWNFSTGWYGDHVDQNVVNRMTDEGLKRLTGQSSVAGAWRMLLPGYSAGKAVAIKANLNNSHGNCADNDNEIDALIEPVNALIRGMKEMGVREQDIWVYDALKALPNRFYARCPYSNVRFVDGGYCVEHATFTSSDPDAEVHFGHSNLTARRIADLVIDAVYLINVPIMKDHAIAGVTLSFKNHFGTLQQIVRPGNDNLHYYICPSDSHYDPSYNPLVDLYMNPHIKGKTVLTVGDGLYGALKNTNTVPQRWSTFGNDAPNSLFFALDPVAIDCVMFDLLDAEPVYHPRGSGGADDYLRLAAGASLGVFERGDPWGSGYDRIDYQKVEL